MAEPRRWFDNSQPQTLQGAVLLAYITAIFGLIGLLFGAVLSVVPVLLGVGAYGIANEKRWGYRLSIFLSGLAVVSALIAILTGGPFGLLINVVFLAILFALLLHPHSRDYQRIWFK